VAAAALDKLLTIDPALVQPLAPELLSRPEGHLRQLAARSLFEHPSIEHVATLSRLLEDPHRDVRESVRESLRQLADRPELRQPVIDGATLVLDSEAWHGLEQSARLVGELDHQPSASRLVVLLEHERPEVNITAAWSLCRLAAPEALPAMLAFTEQVTAGIPVDPAEAHDVRLSPAQDVCLSHLFQAFGVTKFAPAEPLLLKFVPRRYDLGPQSRAAACWALGLLHVNDPQPELAQLLGQRVADSGDIPVPEPVEVRAHAAISLGRMNVPEAVQVLRSVYGGRVPGDPVREACGWALEQITGEDLPDPEVRRIVPYAPFLQPLEQ
jgi:HEAT repeat protein